MLNGYGMAECSPLISVNRDRKNVRGSAGAVIRGTEVRIAGDGEILVKGPGVMSGYYNDEEENARSFTDGYFRTGDIGYLEDDILYVTGRKKNLIIRKNGKNFSPEVIERELLRLPYVRECLVTAEERNAVEIVIARILPAGESDDETVSNFGGADRDKENRSESSACRDGIKGQIKRDITEINRRLPSYMRIDDYELVSREFEKTGSKKIRRSNTKG